MPLEALLCCPAWWTIRPAACDAEADWPAVQQALEAALENLAHMRIEEGQAMATDLEANCRAIAAGLDASSAGPR